MERREGQGGERAGKEELKWKGKGEVREGEG